MPTGAFLDYRAVVAGLFLSAMARFLAGHEQTQEAGKGASPGYESGSWKPAWIE